MGNGMLGDSMGGENRGEIITREALSGKVNIVLYFFQFGKIKI